MATAVTLRGDFPNFNTELVERLPPVEMAHDPLESPQTVLVAPGAPLPAVDEDPDRALPAAASSHEPEGMPFGPGMGGQSGGGPGYGALWIPAQAVRNQATDLGMEMQDVSLMFPIWKSGPDGIMWTTNVRWEMFQTDAILPDSHQAFPKDLWNIRLGTMYGHEFVNGWKGGAMVNVGSASDEPFHSFNETTVSVMGFLRVPQGEHNAWMFTLMYSTNSQVLYGIPIPGVSYFYAPSDAFQATIGFPFASVKYHPCDAWRFEFTYGLLTNIHVRAVYKPVRCVECYAGFDWSNESYLLADRANDQDRFYYYDKRVAAGVKWDICRHASADLSGGYAFDRYYFQGHDRGFVITGPDRVDVGNGPFVAARLTARF